MILSNIRNIDQSETFFAIFLNLDQWIRCCIKSSIFGSGDYNVIIMFLQFSLISHVLINNHVYTN